MKKFWQWLREQHWFHDDEMHDEKELIVRCKTCGRIKSLLWGDEIW